MHKPIKEKLHKGFYILSSANFEGDDHFAYEKSRIQQKLGLSEEDMEGQFFVYYTDSEEFDFISFLSLFLYSPVSNQTLGDPGEYQFNEVREKIFGETANQDYI